MPRSPAIRKLALPLRSNHSLIDYLLLLRYGPTRSRNFSKPILNIISIAKITSLYLSLSLIALYPQFIKLGINMRCNNFKVLL